MVPFQMTLSDP